nr:hypothetical protein Iba_chr12bCG24860 [Ipomoea batatas]
MTKEDTTLYVQVGSAEIRNDDDKQLPFPQISFPTAVAAAATELDSSFTILIFTSPLLGDGLVSGLTLRFGAERSIDSTLKKQSKSYSEQTGSIPEQQRPEKIELRDSELFVTLWCERMKEEEREREE